ncbi:colanic acid biosynthesis glycosyltransferase WcaL [Photobacterium sanctipauli]|uniref:Colanic acid biosynthesis glycosyltransferase WcaL n=1 Tax=Photobacterium sanctipauli TaxID=1342794 RepID=A0A2T3NSF3_9GAMM|nr:glycosyltransferase [Photobacterium sanctipauli]PSW19151.1 colanic acid biosynthesis glycosyltransferase WcaL [Photobacterium sanctipauli]
MKKIGYVIPVFPTLSETFVGVEMRAMASLGHSVQPYAFSSGQHFQSADRELKQQCRYISTSPAYPLRGVLKTYRCHSFIKQQQGFSYLSLLRQGLQLAYWAKQDNCQHLHAHFAWHSTATAIVAAKLLNIPVSFVGHGADIYASPQDIESKLKAADFICAVTQEMQNELQSATERPVLHIPCGIEAKKYPPLPTQWHPQKDFLFIGRLVEKKGLDTLFKAFSHLPLGTELDIVGDGPLRNTLEQQVHQLALQNTIHFLGGKDAAWYQQHAQNYKALVAPFTIAPNGDKDTGPLVVKEAMALGLPVITSTLAGCNEILDHHCGRQVPMDDPEALFHTMASHLKRSVSSLEKQRQSAFQRVTTTFAATTIAKQLSKQVEAL